MVFFSYTEKVYHTIPNILLLMNVKYIHQIEDTWIMYPRCYFAQESSIVQFTQKTVVGLCYYSANIILTDCR